MSLGAIRFVVFTVFVFSWHGKFARGGGWYGAEAAELPQWTAPRAALNNSCAGALWYVDAVEKVFPGDWNSPPSVDASESGVVVRGAPGEHVAFQLGYVLAAPGQVDVDGPLRFTAALDGGTAAADVLVVEYVNVSAANAVNIENRTGPFPDPLPPQPSGGFAPVAPSITTAWVTVKIGTGASGGSVLTGTVGVERVGDGSSVCSAQLRVGVWPSFVVPAAANASQLTGASFGSAVHGGAGPQPDEGRAVKAWYDNVLDHRLNRFVWMEPIARPIVTISPDNKSCTLNTTAYDAETEMLLARGVRSIRFPAPVGGTYMLNTAHEISPDTVYRFGTAAAVPMFASSAVPITFNPDFLSLFNVVGSAIAEHLVAKGWIGLAEAQFVDEPDYNNNFTLAATIAVAKLFHSLHPALRVSQTRYPTPEIPALLAEVDTWVVHVAQWQTAGVPDQLAAQRRDGKTVVMYNNGVEVLDLPATRVQTFPWMLWQTNWKAPGDNLGLQGSLSWYSLSSWSKAGPWANPSNYCPGRRPPCPAGWGYLLYPSKSGPADAPLPVTSIRWELMRKGLEDAEFFAALQRTHGRICSGQPQLDVAEVCATAASALDNVSKAVWNFTGVTQYQPATYTTNATLLHGVKDAVAVQLGALLRVEEAHLSREALVGCSADENCLDNSEAWRCLPTPGRGDPCVTDSHPHWTNCSCGVETCLKLGVAQLTNKTQYLQIGDSISLGYRGDVTQLLPMFETVHPGWNCDNANWGAKCVSGWVDDEASGGGHRWDVVTVNHGLHGLAHPDNEHLQISSYKELLDVEFAQLNASLRADARLVWVTTTPVPTKPSVPLFPARLETDVEAYNAAALSLFGPGGRWFRRVEVCDLHAWVIARCGAGYAACDIQLPGEPHFTAEGYRYLAEKVAKCVEAR